MKKFFLFIALTGFVLAGGNTVPTGAKVADYGIEAPLFSVYAGIAGANCPCSDVNSIDDVLDNTTLLGQIGATYKVLNLGYIGGTVIGKPENNGYWEATGYYETPEFHGLSALVGYTVNQNCTDGDVNYGVEYERNGFYGQYWTETEVASIGYKIKF